MGSAQAITRAQYKLGLIVSQALARIGIDPSAAQMGGLLFG